MPVFVFYQATARMLHQPQAVHNLGRWDARIVSTRWLADSSERQQAVPEKGYLPDFVALEVCPLKFGSGQSHF